MFSSWLGRPSRRTAPRRGPLGFEPLEDRATPAALPIVATAVEVGAAPVVRVYDAATQQPKFDVLAYDASFTGGVRVAVGDVDGDGVGDLITGAGPGGGAVVKVFSGADGKQLRSFLAGDETNRGGASVAAADFDGDGLADVVAGAVSGGRELVQVLKGTDGTVLKEFRPFGATVDGVTVAAADYDGDGTPDVVVGAGAGGAPRVVVLGGKTGDVLLNTFAFEPDARGGVQVAAGDLDGDGRAEVVAAAGQGGGPRVVVLAGGTGEQLGSFFAYDAAGRGGVRVSVFDLDRDGRNDIVTACGSGQTPDLKGFDGRTQAAIPLGRLTAGLPTGSFVAPPASAVDATTPTAPAIAGVSRTIGRASGGTAVTITGTGFAGATAVTFGGAPAAFTVDSDTQLTVVTPAGAAGFVDVAVATRGGTAAAADGFFYATPVAVALFTGGANPGLYAYSADAGTFARAVGPVGVGNVQSYAADGVGRVYYDLGTSGGLSRFDPATGQTLSITASDVTALEVSLTGQAYYAVPTGPDAGTYRFDPRSGAATRFTTEVATGLAAAQNGLVYGQYQTGFYLYDPATAALTLVTADPVGSVYDTAGDGSSVYATVGGNLTRFQRNAAGGFDAGVAITTGLNIVSFSASDSGQVYIDTSVNGTRMYDPGTGVVSLIDPRNPVFVAADPFGDAYLDYAGNGGTVRYMRATGTLETLSTNPNAFFGADDVDAAGNLYLDYNADGLFRYDPAHPTTTTVSSVVLAGTRISTENPDSSAANG